MTTTSTQGQYGAPNGGAAPAVEWVGPDGRQRVTPLTRAGLTVGSAPASAIQLAGADVARFHLRIDWDGQQATVKALSPRGALLGQAPLPPPQGPGAVWQAGTPLLVGGHQLRLGRAGGLAQPALAAAGGIEIRLDGDAETIELTPGQAQSIRARVYDRARAGERVRFAVEGLNPAWILAKTDEVKPGPTVPAIASFQVLVPQSSESRAGSYPVTLRAIGERASGERQVRCEVSPYADHALDVQPSRVSVANDTPGRFNVVVRNTGNATMSYKLRAGYDEPGVECRLERGALVVEPGQEQTVALSVYARDRLGVREASSTFGVECIPAAGQARHATATYLRTRKAPLWAWPLALAGLLLLLGLGGWLAGRLIGAAIAGVPAPTAPPALLTSPAGGGFDTPTPAPPSDTPTPQDTADLPAIAAATQTAAALLAQVASAQSLGTAAVAAAQGEAAAIGQTAGAQAAAAVQAQADQASSAQAQQSTNAAAVDGGIEAGVAGTAKALAAQATAAAPLNELQTRVAVLAFTPTSTATSTSTPTSTSTASPTATPTPTQAANLGLNVRGSPNPVAAGAVLTYTISVNNRGPDFARDVNLTSGLPASVDVITDSLPQPCSVSTGNRILCNLLNMDPAATRVITYAVTVKAASGVVANTVQVNSATDDPIPGDNIVVNTTDVDVATDLAVAIRASAPSVGAGQPVTYTMTMTNTGLNDATRPNLFTEVTEGTVIRTSSTPDLRCQAAGNRLTCNSPNALRISQVLTAEMVVEAPRTLPRTGVITTTTSASSSLPDPNPGNNTRSVATRIDPAADLGIGLRAPERVRAQQPLTYTIDLTNAGPTAARNITVTLTLPEGDQRVVYNRAEGAGWSCNSSRDPVIACTRSPAGEEFQPGRPPPPLTVIVTAPQELADLSATANVAAATLDPDRRNNRSQPAATKVDPDAELTLDVTAPPRPIADGSSFSYTITVNNAGPSTAADVVLVHTLDPRVTYNSFSAPDGWGCSYDATTRQFTCSQSRLIRSDPRIVVNVTAPVNPDNNPLSIGSTTTVTSPTDRTPPDAVTKTVEVYLRPALTGLASAPPQPAVIERSDPITFDVVAAARGTNLTYRWSLRGAFAPGTTCGSTPRCRVTLAPGFAPGLLYIVELTVANEVGTSGPQQVTYEVRFPPPLP